MLLSHGPGLLLVALGLAGVGAFLVPPLHHAESLKRPAWVWMALCNGIVVITCLDEPEAQPNGSAT